MTNNIASKILRFYNWKINTPIKLPPKCIICVAPHTSNWDFVIGILVKSALKIKASFFMKKEWFRFPLGYFMKKLGGIPVERTKKTSMTDRIAHEFTKRENLIIAVTPEGTRSYNPEWKKGFYYIAIKSQTPIVLAYIDYKNKEVGYSDIFFPTGNVDKDIQVIKNFYKNITAKYPEKFGI